MYFCVLSNITIFKSGVKCLPVCLLVNTCTIFCCFFIFQLYIVSFFFKFITSYMCKLLLLQYAFLKIICCQSMCIYRCVFTFPVFCRSIFQKKNYFPLFPYLTLTKFPLATKFFEIHDK